MTEPTPVRVRACGKVNLALRVGPADESGYHELATVFQGISLYDEVSVVDAAPDTFPITVAGEQAALVPADDRNLAVKAARLLAQAYGQGRDLGAAIAISKTIPVTGGMAGGSADAAATLLACSVLWDLDVSPSELDELAAQLGADVPFSLLGGVALGTGRGDRLAPVLSRGTTHWVLALSDGELSTPAVFRRFDEITPDPQRPRVSPELMNALIGGDAVALAKELTNDLQQAALSMRPQLADIVALGEELGALKGIVSGSGPTIAFLAAGEQQAIDLSVRLSSEGVCRAVRRVQGPVPGARLIS